MAFAVGIANSKVEFVFPTSQEMGQPSVHASPSPVWAGPVLLMVLSLGARSAPGQAVKGKPADGAPPPPLRYHGLEPGVTPAATVRQVLGEPGFEAPWYAYKMLYPARILDRMRILETELQIIRHQREHYDGSGHPAGRVGNEIPIGSRTVMVADAFDSMTTDRVYRPRKSITDALVEIERLSGEQFDPRIVAALHDEGAESAESWQARIDAASRHAKQNRPFELVC